MQCQLYINTPELFQMVLYHLSCAVLIKNKILEMQIFLFIYTTVNNQKNGYMQEVLENCFTNGFKDDQKQSFVHRLEVS